MTAENKPEKLLSLNDLLRERISQGYSVILTLKGEERNEKEKIIRKIRWKMDAA